MPFHYLCTLIMMKRYFWLMLAVVLVACGNNKHRAARTLLDEAQRCYAEGRYTEALVAIDSLRRTYPDAIDARKEALALYQEVELKRTQEELSVTDSVLQAVGREYDTMQQQVEQHRAALCATEQELDAFNRLRVRRDSLQAQFDVLCAKIRYIRKKQSEP